MNVSFIPNNKILYKEIDPKIADAAYYMAQNLGGWA